MAAIMESSMMRMTVRKFNSVRYHSFTSFCHVRSLSTSVCSCQRNREEKTLNEGTSEFRTYEIPGLRAKQGKKRFQRRKKEVAPPRYKQMRTDQDWTSVWPSMATFKWSVVPLPVRQGFVQKTTENDGITPGKYANAELMKPPNFLHLTPNHIKKHCEAIKKYCTPWPNGLRKDSTIKKHFPVTVTTADYCFASPSIRDPRARKITIQIPLSSLKLDYHARDKLLRLVKFRYKAKTDTLTISADRCPVRKQNYDYVMYLLTAVYFESWKKEPWEEEKTEADREKYLWMDSASHKSVVNLLQRIKESEQSTSEPSESSNRLTYLPDNLSDQKVVELEPVKEYSTAVSEVINEGENYESLRRYKDSVKKMLNIRS